MTLEKIYIFISIEWEPSCARDITWSFKQNLTDTHWTLSVAVSSCQFYRWNRWSCLWLFFIFSRIQSMDQYDWATINLSGTEKIFFWQFHQIDGYACILLKSRHLECRVLFYVSLNVLAVMHTGNWNGNLGKVKFSYQMNIVELNKTVRAEVRMSNVNTVITAILHDAFWLWQHGAHSTSKIVFFHSRLTQILNIFNQGTNKKNTFCTYRGMGSLRAIVSSSSCEMILNVLDKQWHIVSPGAAKWIFYLTLKFQSAAKPYIWRMKWMKNGFWFLKV